MLFAPDGIGGLINAQARRLKPGGIKRLVAPYLLCLVVGLLLIAGVVFVVESIHVLLSDAHMAKRRASGGVNLPYMLFGREFDPVSAATWAIPATLLIAGGALLPLATRITRHAWTLASQSAGDHV
jgi:branched-chain amino acid transport system permease protein